MANIYGGSRNIAWTRISDTDRPLHSYIEEVFLQSVASPSLHATTGVVHQSGKGGSCFRWWTEVVGCHLHLHPGYWKDKGYEAKDYWLIDLISIFLPKGTQSDGNHRMCGGVVSSVLEWLQCSFLAISCPSHFDSSSLFFFFNPECGMSSSKADITLGQNERLHLKYYLGHQEVLNQGMFIQVWSSHACILF